MEVKQIYSLLLLIQMMLIYKASCKECVYLYSGGNMYFNGTVDRSVYGHECQRWDSTIGVSGFYYTDFLFGDDGSMSAANNYCRDPYRYGNEIFCYTLNPGLTKELCSVALCDDASEEHVVTIDGEMMRCRIPPENGECDIDELYVCKDTYKVVNSKKKRKDCFKLFCCTQRGCWDHASNYYNGTWRHSKNGVVCKDWNSYLGSADPDPYNMPELSLEDAMNYCRDPDLTGEPWCYTNMRGFRGSFVRLPCGIPSCADYQARHTYDHDCYEITDKDLEQHKPLSESNEICDSVPGRVYLEEISEKYLYPGCAGCNCCQKKGCIMGNGSDYMGTWSRTLSGRKCKPWNETVYQGKDELFPDKTVADAENYCRHTSDNNIVVLWCFTDDKYMEKERCDIPNCDDVISTTVVSMTTENIPTTTHIGKLSDSQQTVGLNQTVTNLTTTELSTLQSTTVVSVTPLSTGAIVTSGLITSPLFWMIHMLSKGYF